MARRGTKGQRRRVKQMRLRLFLAIVAVALMILSALTLLVQNPDKDPLCKGSALCYTADVKHIVDGDTLDIGSDRIRLALVNSPEVGEAGYWEAKNFTAAFCPLGSQATVDEDDGQTGGSYGRVVAVVYCGGKNLNAELLSSGHAVLLTEFCSVSEFSTEEWAGACP